MNRFIFLLLVLTFSMLRATAHEERNPVKLGFQLNQFQSDFGLGLNFTSPKIKQHFAIRLRLNFMFNEHLQKGETVWTPYQNIGLGFMSGEHEISENLFLYGEGGVMCLFPSSEFSSESFELAGYGLFGFQFNFDPNFGYFIEMGGIGTGAVEDKVPTKPIYSNGFLISVGWRMKL